MTVSVKAPTSNTGSIQLNGSDVLTIDSSGNLTVPNNLTSTGGIYLGGTTSANLLDDYEEGTWTPTIEGNSTAGTATYSVQKGVYTKIGDTVHINVYIGWNSGTGTGAQLLIKGLPFTSLSGYFYGLSISGISSLGGNTSGNVIFARCESNTSTIGIYGLGTGTTISDAGYPYQSSGLMLWSGSYKIN